MIILFFTISLSWSQCFQDRHNSNWYNGWISCSSSENPNTTRGNSHWIMYNFGHVYQLGQMDIWNINSPDYLDDGIREMYVDYSVDGETWETLGEFSINQGDGSSFYEGTEGADFDGVEAQYVLITAKSNYGGSCYGFSEIRFWVDGIVAVDDIADEELIEATVSPNPFTSVATLHIRSVRDDPVYYSISDELGNVIVKNQELALFENKIILSGKDFAPGIYFVWIRQGELTKELKFIRIK